MAKQNTIRKTIHRNVERELVREYLLRETERAGYGGLKFNRTPEGTEVTIQAEMVGRVYGRRFANGNVVCERVDESGNSSIYFRVDDVESC